MSIVDAIQRAKQMGMHRRATDRVSVAPPLMTGGIPSSSSVQGPPIDQAFVGRVDFARLEYDPVACTENRIAVPEAEHRLTQIASPPYRMLRTRFLQRCKANLWTRLAITSPGPGEGKSVTSLNLALSIAREGNYDVFLLDLDMRNPSMCRYLGLSPATELASYFQGGVEAREAFFTIGIDRLTLAGNVRPTANASELLATDRLEELFRYIRQVAPNPLVLIDLPPVASTDDALVVAPRVDAIALVVSEGHTRRDILQHALGLLSEFNVAGIILNRSHESTASEYYGGAYA